MFNRKAAKTDPKGKQPDAVTAELTAFALEESEDRKVMRLSLWVAVMLHVVLLAFNFPALTAEPQVPPPKKKVFEVKAFVYKPPEPEPAPEMRAPRVKRQPVPAEDPTAPEPIRLEEPVTDIELPYDADAVIVIPDAPPEPEPVGPIFVRDHVQRPIKIYAPQPHYTEIARKARIQGVVIVQAIIDKEGNVTNVRLLKTLPMGLGDEAAKTIKTWKFKPATLRGKPVDVYYNLTVNFQLQ